MAGSRGAARSIKVDLKGNAREVVAWSREMGNLTSAARTTTVVNIMLAAMTQVSQSGIVKEHENPSKKSGSWYEVPVPGSDHRMALPTLYDMRSNTALIVYKRDSKGHILDREVSQFGPMRPYLFRDKWVSRTGSLLDTFLFDWGKMDLDEIWKTTDFQRVSGAHEVIYLEAFDGMKIAGRDGVALFQTTPDKYGQKIAFLERSRADQGRLQPRYVILRAIQSTARRWSTAFKSEMKRAEKLADKAAKRAKGDKA